jgi:hypothetical protein
MLNDLFQLRGRAKLIDPIRWELYRADICYAWRFPSQDSAQQYLDSLKHLHYPRKAPAIYATSVVFSGTTYSFKFYLKLPEFRTHDLKELRKSKASIEWMNHLEDLADGVLRCEATLRRKWLKNNGFLTVADLLKPVKQIHWDFPLAESEGFVWEKSLAACLMHWTQERGFDINQNLKKLTETSLENGDYFAAPPSDWKIGDEIYHHNGGGFTFRVIDRKAKHLEEFIEKYLGKELTMLEANQVQAKLLASYKPVKAARLVSLWLYVQKFGSQQAKQTFGENSYYRSKRELKQAGVSLLEAQSLITTIDDDFLKKFAPLVPSPHVVNRVDDFREKGNVLNFVPRTSGNF